MKEIISVQYSRTFMLKTYMNIYFWELKNDPHIKGGMKKLLIFLAIIFTFLCILLQQHIIIISYVFVGIFVGFLLFICFGIFSTYYDGLKYSRLINQDGLSSLFKYDGNSFEFSDKYNAQKEISTSWKEVKSIYSIKSNTVVLNLSNSHIYLNLEKTAFLKLINFIKSKNIGCEVIVPILST